jgi:hypothetical protein
VGVSQWQTVGTNDKIVLQDFGTPDKILVCARDKSVDRLCLQQNQKLSVKIIKTIIKRSCLQNKVQQNTYIH